MNTSERHPLLLQRRASWLAAAIGIAFAGVAVAAPQWKTIELGIESGTESISLPANAGGTLSASTCSDCPTLRLKFDAKTVYLIGKQAVSYAKFREAAAGGDLRLEVFYRPNTNVLTRLRLPADESVK